MILAPVKVKPKLVISPTQVEAFDLCNRKWWFQSVKKLPRIRRDFQDFGITFHSLAERWLKADDTGRDEQGNAVDLFPAGWDKSITPAESSLLRDLFDKAVSEGVLIRLPHRVIEYNFGRGWEPNETYFWLTNDVAVTGLIDLMGLDTVEDHKTTKNKRYIKSREALKKSPQMLIYSRVLLEVMRLRGQPTPHEVKVAHNVMVKDPINPWVKKVDARIPVVDVIKYWDELKIKSQLMVEVAQLKHWTTVPGPVSYQHACQAFGGCEFRGICGKQMTPEEYERRVNMNLNVPMVGQQHLPQANPTQSQPGMSMNDALSQLPRLGAQPAFAPPPVGMAAAQPPPPQQQPAPQVSPALLVAQAPWACCGPGVACGGSGFNSKGNPCMICRSNCAQAGKPSPDQYRCWVDQGYPMFQHATGGQVYAVQLPAPLHQQPTAQISHDPAPMIAPPTVPNMVAAPMALAQAVPQVPVAQAPSVPPVTEAPGMPAAPAPASAPARRGRKPKAEQQQTDPTDDTENTSELIGIDAANEQISQPDRQGPGRPRRTFSLYIGCLPVRGTSRSTVSAEEIFNQAAAALAKGNNSPSYWQLDPFARRDSLAQMMPSIVAQLPRGCIVLASAGEHPDANAFLWALKPYADFLVQTIG